MRFLRKFFTKLLDNPLLGLVVFLPAFALLFLVGPPFACASMLVRSGPPKQRWVALVLLPFSFLPLYAALEYAGVTGRTKTSRPPPASKTYRTLGESITQQTEATLNGALGPPVQRAAVEREGARSLVLTWEDRTPKGGLKASFVVTLKPCGEEWCAEKAKRTVDDDTTTYSDEANANRASRKWWSGLFVKVFMGFLGAVAVFVTTVQVVESFTEARKEVRAERARKKAEHERRDGAVAALERVEARLTKDRQAMASARAGALARAGRAGRALAPAEEAAILRAAADEAWEVGRKEEATLLHRAAAELVVDAEPG